MTSASGRRSARARSGRIFRSCSAEVTRNSTLGFPSGNQVITNGRPPSMTGIPPGFKATRSSPWRSPLMAGGGSPLLDSRLRRLRMKATLSASALSGPLPISPLHMLHRACRVVLRPPSEANQTCSGLVSGGKVEEQSIQRAMGWLQLELSVTAMMITRFASPCEVQYFAVHSLGRTYGNTWPEGGPCPSGKGDLSSVASASGRG